ncbi:hypothetical protein HYPBUDRAFT_152880 [Hyphopichia burtonii NRRL Y-1933]|uniref:Uncharacterized protein n=1 Tax=Hyphopichia burtonii NRRL Y-1933 TaxID=984485 RepID=A0A1E4RHV2_9ASCO|nr:hypothetical protein HYPBUDRAFT_152880 [Hyphopichia burtonii NRRL Y-1933]ODV66830.1 hypothetical protein HYPBUDRAFT_152880 [Hyphopichia burtonii NRRL Y-1933]
MVMVRMVNLYLYADATLSEIPFRGLAYRTGDGPTSSSQETSEEANFGLVSVGGIRGSGATAEASKTIMPTLSTFTTRVFHLGYLQFL